MLPCVMLCECIPHAECYVLSYMPLRRVEFRLFTLVEFGSAACRPKGASATPPPPAKPAVAQREERATYASCNAYTQAHVHSKHRSSNAHSKPHAGHYPQQCECSTHKQRIKNQVVHRVRHYGCSQTIANSHPCKNHSEKKVWRHCQRLEPVGKR